MDNVSSKSHRYQDRNGYTSNSGATHVSNGGDVRFTDRRSGDSYNPSRSRVTDVHESRSGKSVIVEHRDGIQEIHNKATGRVTYQHNQPQERAPERPRPPVYDPPSRYDRPRPPAVDPSPRYDRPRPPHVDPRPAPRQHYPSYRDYPQYQREPVFRPGYRWQPPIYAPIRFTFGMTLPDFDTVYRREYSRDSVSNMTGVSRYAFDFRRAGIYDSYDLVRAGRTPEDRNELAYRTGIPREEVRKAVGQADLMRVNGIGPHNSRLLVDAGINSMQDLARYTWDPESLYDQLRYSSYWSDQQTPSRGEVRSWIEQAQSLPLAIYDDND